MVGLQDRQITHQLLDARRRMTPDQIARTAVLLEQHRVLVADRDRAAQAVHEHVTAMRSFLAGVVDV